MTFTFREITDIIPVLPSTVDNIRLMYPWPANPETGVEYSYFAHYKFDEELLDPLFLDIMQWGGMGVKHCEVFYRPGTGEEFDAFIHVDGHKVVDCVAKINWVMGGQQNLMRWYLPTVEVSERHELTTNAGTKYLTFQPHEVEEIAQCDMHGVYVVNAGVPHSVDMVAGSPDEPRICLSIVPGIRDPKTKEIISGAMGGDEVYLRLVWGAGVMRLIDRDSYANESVRIRGCLPAAEAMSIYWQKCQQYDRIQDFRQSGK